MSVVDFVSDSNCELEGQQRTRGGIRFKRVGDVERGQGINE